MKCFWLMMFLLFCACLCAQEGFLNPGFDIDKDSDGFPDGWRQLWDADTLHYGRFYLSTKNPFSGEKCLGFDLVGTAGKMLSSPVNVDPRKSYTFSASVRTVGLDSVGLRQTWAGFEARFYDAKGVMVQSLPSERLSGSTEWRKLTLTVDKLPQDAQTVRLVLAIVGKGISGSVYFDEVGLQAVPRLRLSTTKAGNLFALADSKNVDIRVSGLDPVSYSAVIEVLSAAGASIFKNSETLPPQKDGAYAAAQSLKIDQQGLFTVTLTLIRDGAEVTRASVNVGVLGIDSSSALCPDYGVVIRQAGDAPENQAEIVKHLGVGWAKVNLWSERTGLSGRTADDRLDRMIKGLKARGIKVVGVLNAAAVVPASMPATRPSVSEASSSQPAQKWRTLVENTVAHYSDRVEAWQLGEDGVSSPWSGEALDAASAAAAIIERLAPQAPIGFAVASGEPPDSFKKAGAGFVSLTLDTAQGPGEIPPALGAIGGGVPRWVTIRLAGGERTSSARRLAELLLAARRAETPLLFLDPLEGTSGALMDSRDAPTPVFFASAVLLKSLSGCRAKGSFDLPGGSVMNALEKDGSISLVGWNDRADAAEDFYLGERLARCDLMANCLPVPVSAFSQKLQLGPEPAIFTGVDAELFNTRMSLQLAPETLFSSLDEQKLAVRLTNGFAIPVTGEIQIACPNGWSISPNTLKFQIETGKTWQGDLAVKLPADEPAGARRIMLALSVSAEKAYKVDVERNLGVEARGFKVDVELKRAEGDVGLVLLTLANEDSSPLTLKASLEIEGRSTAEHDLQPLKTGESRQDVFNVEGISKLGGKDFYLRLSEPNGRRFYNKRLTFNPGKG